MPLNIDIQQILLHLFNFAILLAGLYLLLYKPVKKFMNKRTEYYAQMDAQAKESLAEAEKMKASRAAQLDSVDDEIRKKRMDAAARIDEQTARMIEEAQSEADRILADAHDNADLERQKIVSSARQEVVDLAAELAGKMIRQSFEMAEESDENEG
ncbi:MAG: ATP synthase F0 subunit B [Clostridiales bacterium]|nr:ATP synthase F0 subunit B [Clostridiales bacterium]